MQEQVVQAVRQAMNGSRQLRITFNQDLSQKGARGLLTMMLVHLIWMPPYAWGALSFLSVNGHWGKDTNMVMEIVLNHDDGGFNESLINEIARGIEKIEVIN